MLRVSTETVDDGNEESKDEGSSLSPPSVRSLSNDTYPLMSRRDSVEAAERSARYILIAMALVFILAFILVGFFHESHSSRPGRDERAPQVLRTKERGDDGHGTGDSQAILKRLQLLELESL